MKFRHWIILCLPLFLLTCKSNQRVIKSNLAYLYFDEETIIHPQYKAYHQDESTTTLYVRVNAKEILYSRNNPQKEFHGKMVMQVQVYEENERKPLVSDTVYLIDKSGPGKDKFLMGHIDLNLPTGMRYIAEVTFDDLYRMQYVQDVVHIDKTSEFSEENYLIKDEKGNILFGNAFDPGSKLMIETSRSLPSKIKVQTFDPFESLPPPPFVTQNIENDEFSGKSEMEVSRKDANHFELELGEAGIYFIPSETGEGSGLTMLAFHSYYPYIKTVPSMVRPMRFITTKQEYQNLVKSENLKKDVDEFWYKIAGNSERASEIIREYYTRVEIANMKFTSFAQGWQTDRGLVYMIYGPPSVVYKTENYEAWSYNEKTNIMTVEFVFHKVDHPLSNNHYELNRATGYKSSWYRAIDSWRQGRVF